MCHPKAMRRQKKDDERDAESWVFLSLPSFLLLALTTSCFARAGEERLEEVKVIGKRLVEDTPVEEAEVPATVSVIKAKDYEEQMVTVDELLESEAGVQVKRYGGLGDFSSISIRGSSNKQVLVFLDGVLLNPSIGGGIDLSTIPLSQVEFIEIYRGVTPARYGAQGLMGVVNIRTKQMREEPTTVLRWNVGSFATLGASLFHSRRVGNYELVFSTSYLDSDGDYEFLDDRATLFNKKDDRWVERINNDFTQRDFLFKLGYETEGWRLDFSNSFFRRARGVPGRSNNQSRHARYTVSRNVASLRLYRDSFLLPMSNLTLRLSHLYTLEKFRDTHSEIGLGKQNTRNVTETYLGNFHWSIPAGEHNLFGLTYEARFEQWRPEDELAGVQPPNSRRTSHSLSFEDEISLFDDRLVLLPSLRWDYYRSKLQGKPGLQTAITTRTDDYFNSAMGLKFDITPSFLLKANYSRATRVPSFFELFGDRGTTVGNPALEAEESTNLDAGLRLQFRDAGILRNFVLEATLFKSKIENLIGFVYDARGIGRAVNFSEVEVQGIELRNSFQLGKHIRLIQNYTWQDPRNMGKVPGADQPYLPSRAKKEYFARLELFSRDARVFFELSHTGPYFRDMTNLIEAESQNIINAGVTFRYKAFSFTFEVKNLEDERVEDVAGYPLPGRAFFFTVRAEF